MSRLRRGMPKYDLRDTFDDGRAAGEGDGTYATDGVNTRTDVDTDSKLTQSDSKLNLAPHSTPAWGDPGRWYDAQTREAGLVLLGTVKIDDVTNLCEFGFDAGQSGVLTVNALRVTSDTIVPYDSGSAGPAVAVPADATEYRLAVVLRSTGAFYYIKGGAFTSWTLLWISDTDNTATVYPAAITNSATLTVDNMRISKTRWLDVPLLSDGFGSAGPITESDGLGHAEGVAGGLGSGGGGMVYEPNTWTSDGSKASSNITLRGELLENGNMETGDPPTGWVPQGGPPVLDGVADERTGGAGIQSMDVAMGGGDFWGRAYRAAASTLGTWYQMTGWVRNVDAVEGWLALWESTVSAISEGARVAGINWVQSVVTGRATGANVYAYCRIRAAVNGNSCRFDDVSIKEIPLSDCFLAQDAGTPDVLVSNPAIVTAGTQGGAHVRLDDAANPANFIIATHDGTNVKVEKCVAGTYTTLISAATAYVADKDIILVTDGTSVDCYYNNAKVGTTQTVSDAGIVDNTLHGSFSTYDDNTIAKITAYKRKGYDVPS